MDLTIPDNIGGYKVNCIGPRAFSQADGLSNIVIPYNVEFIEFYAFYGCNNLRTIIIPNSVTKIGKCAFYLCGNLRSIHIPDSVTTIEELAFYRSGLESVTIPENVTSMEEEVFGECPNLTKISVDSNNEYYKSIDGVLFTKDKITLKAKTLLCYPMSRPGEEYIIPNGVERIESYAFDECKNLKKLFIPRSVTEIANDAICDCPNITIYARKGSAAEAYAREKNMLFVEINYTIYEIEQYDISGDGDVTLEDVEYIQRVLNDKNAITYNRYVDNEKYLMCDVTLDREINLLDAYDTYLILNQN